MKICIILVGTGELVQSIERVLQDEGYEVKHIEWIELSDMVDFKVVRPHLIILVDRESEDTQQSVQDKIVLKRCMNPSSSTPLMVIIPEISPQRVIDWLDFGANDVMQEPVHWKVMLARIRSLLRLFASATHEGEEIIVVHDLRINLRSRRVSRGGQYLNLTPKEYELLEF